MSRSLLTIIPGPTRSKDRIYPNDQLEIELYNPARDMSLTPEQRKWRLSSLKVSVQGGPKQSHPFVLGCQFWVDCDSIEELEAATGDRFVVGDPVGEDEEIGRSVMRDWIALGDGSVYTSVKPSGSDAYYVQKWPILLDPEWLAEQKALHEQVVTPQRVARATDLDCSLDQKHVTSLHQAEARMRPVCS